MSEKQIKLIRKQIRNIVQELFPTTWTTESKLTVAKELAPIIADSLKDIKGQLEVKMNNDEIQRQKENELIKTASDQLREMNVSMLAWQTALKGQLDKASVIGPEFDAEMEELKSKIREDMTKNEKV